MEKKQYRTNPIIWILIIVMPLFSSVLTWRLNEQRSNNFNTNSIKQVSVLESSAIIDVVKKSSPSVVSIVVSTNQQTLFGNNEVEAAGTGFVVDKSGLIITNRHVIEGAAAIKVVLSNNDELEAKLVDADTLNDLAIIKVEKNDLVPLELGDSDQLQIGQKVIAIGNALGQFYNTVTDGIVSGIGRPISAQTGTGVENLSNLIQTDAAINPGNSGGPLVNIDGQVIGINVAKAGDAQGISFAIPINEVKIVIDSVIKSGKITRPYLGIRYVANSAEIKKQYDLAVDYGVIITGGVGSPAVIKGSPAEKAGLEDQDIITKINDFKIDGNNSLSSILAKFKVGDKIKIEYYRGQDLKNTELILESKDTN